MKRISTIVTGAVTAIAALGMATTLLAATITGAGATFPFSIYAKWAAVYHDATGNAVNYHPMGSGGES